MVEDLHNWVVGVETSTFFFQGTYHVQAIVPMLEKIYR
jgi:hypothetical protein